MRYSTQIKPISAFKANAAEILGQIAETRMPVIITQNGRPTSVLHDIETYQRSRDALLLLMAIAQGDRDYRAGRVVSDAEADRRFRKVLAKLHRG